VPACEDTGRWHTAFEGYVIGWTIRCAKGFGCTVNPAFKRTAHLRWFDAA
jgi:hypothetical protein